MESSGLSEDQAIQKVYAYKGFQDFLDRELTLLKQSALKSAKGFAGFQENKRFQSIIGMSDLLLNAFVRTVKTHYRNSKSDPARYFDRVLASRSAFLTNPLRDRLDYLAPPAHRFDLDPDSKSSEAVLKRATHILVKQGPFGVRLALAIKNLAG